MIAHSSLEGLREIDGRLLLFALQIELVNTTLGDH